MSETFYARVARDLAEGIANGRFPVGSHLPRELDLCTHYEASRHTVRAAIRELQGLGLVSRKKRAGTRVENISPVRGFRQSLASVEDLVQFGAAHRRVIQNIGDVVVSRELARQLGCVPGRAFLRISSLRLSGDLAAPPIAWTDVYIDPAYASLRDVIGEYPEVLVSDLIEARHGRRIAEIHQDVQAVTLSAALARALEAKAGAPGLRMIRRYLDPAGEAFEISATIHPADRFTFSMSLRRERE